MITPEHFVTTWTASRTCAEAAASLQMSAAATRSRASYYRQRGIKLKRMANGKPTLDLARLNALALPPGTARSGHKSA